MDWRAIAGAVLFIGGALVVLFAPGLLWRENRAVGRAVGLEERRTGFWDVRRVVSGVLALLLGLILLAVGFSR